MDFTIADWWSFSQVVFLAAIYFKLGALHDTFREMLLTDKTILRTNLETRSQP